MCCLDALPWQPVTPTLTVNLPVTMGTIELTCGTPTEGITAYEFKRGDTSLSVSPCNKYIINIADIGAEGHSYTCIAYIDTVASDDSDPHVISSE